MSSPEESGNNGIPIESADARSLSQLAGAAFLQNPGFTLVLPSGVTLNRDETRVFTELHRAPDNLLNLDRPPLVGVGEHLPDNYVLSFSRATHDEYQEKLRELEDITEVMAPHELLDITEAFVGSLNKGALRVCIETARQQRDAAQELGMGDLGDEYANVSKIGDFEYARIASSNRK
jgi:hypothetical protein